MELGRLLDGEIARPRAIQDFVHADGNVPNILEIAGATPGEAFRYVTLPLIMPGVVAGALVAFTLSIDDSSPPAPAP